MIRLATLLLIPTAASAGDYVQPPELDLNLLERCLDRAPLKGLEDTRDAPEAITSSYRSALQACASVRRAAIAAAADRLQRTRPGASPAARLNEAELMMLEYEADHIHRSLTLRFGPGPAGNPVIAVEDRDAPNR